MGFWEYIRYALVSMLNMFPSGIGSPRNQTWIETSVGSLMLFAIIGVIGLLSFFIYVSFHRKKLKKELRNFCFVFIFLIVFMTIPLIGVVITSDEYTHDIRSHTIWLYSVMTTIFAMFSIILFLVHKRITRKPTCNN